MERVRGILIGECEWLIEVGYDPDRVLQVSAEVFFYQVFRDGFFHGDMHGGNVFVDVNGIIVSVDFGIMGCVDDAMCGYFAELLIVFLHRDYRAVVEVQFRVGFVLSDKSFEVFAQVCCSIGESIFGKSSNQISVVRLLAQLLRVTEQFEMQVQSQLLLLQKTMLMAEGMGTKFNPDINIWQFVWPLIEDWMCQHFGPRARMECLTTEIVDGLRCVPRLIDNLEIIVEWERQQVEVEVVVRFARRGWRACRAELLVGVVLIVVVFVLFF